MRRWRFSCQAFLNAGITGWGIGGLGVIVRGGVFAGVPVRMWRVGKRLGVISMLR